MAIAGVSAIFLGYNWHQAEVEIAVLENQIKQLKAKSNPSVAPRNRDSLWKLLDPLNDTVTDRSECKREGKQFQQADKDFTAARETIKEIVKNLVSEKQVAESEVIAKIKEVLDPKDELKLQYNQVIKNEPSDSESYKSEKTKWVEAICLYEQQKNQGFKDDVRAKFN